MSAIEYQRDFWQRAYQLVDSPQVCEQCKRHHNNKARPKVTVRVVLTGKGMPLPTRLKLLCTQCFRDPVPVRITRKLVLDRIAQLPFPNPGPGVTGRG